MSPRALTKPTTFANPRVTRRTPPQMRTLSRLQAVPDRSKAFQAIPPEIQPQLPVNATLFHLFHIFRKKKFQNNICVPRSFRVNKPVPTDENQTSHLFPARSESNVGTTTKSSELTVSFGEFEVSFVRSN